MVMMGQGRLPANNDPPPTTLNTLRVQYNKATPNKKRDNKRNWSAAWKTPLPIKNLFYCPKMCFIIAIVPKPLYT